MRTVFLLLVLFVTCAAKQQLEVTLFQSPVSRKQKQKMIVLEKKLAAAEKTLQADQAEVEQLRSQLCDAELACIELQLEALERRWQSDPVHLVQSLKIAVAELFLKEREHLCQFIQTGLEVFRSQNLLDRILQLMTQLSEGETIS